MFHLDAPENTRKLEVILVFSRGIEMKHWPEMD